jgi:hypothetical protein
MLSAVGESAQVALQASTMAPPVQAAARVDNKAAEKATEEQGAKAKGDTVTISTQARQLTQSALKASEESQESPQQKSKEESAGKK